MYTNTQKPNKSYTLQIKEKRRFDFHNFDSFLEKFETTKSPNKKINTVDSIAYGI